MDDRIDRLMESVEGDGPSPEFVANLRQRVLDEATWVAHDTRIDAKELVTVTSRPRTEARPTRLRLLVASAAAVLAIVAVALSLVASNDDQLSTTDEPSTPITAVPITAIPITVTTEPTDVPTPAGPDRFDPVGATPLNQEFYFLEAGSYRIDSLGTPLSFRSNQQLFITRNPDGAVVLADRNSSSSDEREMVMMRASAFVDPERPSEPLDDFDDGRPALDVAGWLDDLDRLGGGVVVADRQATTIGGLDAIRIDMRIEDEVCAPAQTSCVNLATNRLVFTKSMGPGVRYRLWIVDQFGEDPLVAIASIEDDSDGEWFDTADDLLSSLMFGNVTPNPVSTTPAGSARLPFLGGIEVELPEDLVVIETFDDFGRIPFRGEAAETQFLTNPRSADGAAFQTVDQLLDHLGDFGLDITEIAPTAIDGVETRVFDLAGRVTTRALLIRHDDDGTGWVVDGPTRLWLIEHPDRGLLTITARAVDAELASAVNDRTTELVESMEFVDPI
jgi:hypothetical protein